ncbi:hypothetical protein P170DRAFT_439153 [Aspergillus steynii IBT 23096]|uniref:Uncharacterized protein n=1 Tax=Aspergillus steynii IBT 23096 TaxID=1392250 RepID=A0A2I2FXM2_9EURO|nr:uncharacterized protein P170DRAFT_439153 [Aspergillus steynii IBT 23096]PLB45384.1 hypothetical protein P170DRAFT_439153 [Aspergillus steynii IBT 23096]
MDSILSLIQEFKELRRSRRRAYRPQSPPPEPEYFPYPPLDNRTQLRSARAPKKTVRWGPVMEMGPLPPARYYTPGSHVSDRRPVKSILKPPTRLDQEMFRHNMWRMVGMADERLEFTYQCIGDMRNMGNSALDFIMKCEEHSVRNELTRKVLETAYQLNELSLEEAYSRSLQHTRLRRRRTSR